MNYLRMLCMVNNGVFARWAYLRIGRLLLKANKEIIT